MKIAKYFALGAAALFTANAFADAANVLVSFSTTADKYADGTPVKDGEWYALCWSADGNFEGLKLDCTPVDANDMVCTMLSLAKDGKCPYTVFQIDSQSEKCKRTGVYSVMLLDTRDANGAVATTKPTSVNAAIAAKDYTAGSEMAGTAEKAPAGETKEWAQSAIDETVAGYKQPVIKDFKVIGDAKVKIEVVDMMPNVKYSVKMGSSVDDLNVNSIETAAGVDKATFVIESKDAKFFQVTRDPLKK